MKPRQSAGALAKSFPLRSHARMETRWTYTRDRSVHGDPLEHALTVRMNGSPVGWVRLVSAQDKSQWQWRVTLTDDHGHADMRDGALNALRDSVMEFLENSI